MSTIELRQNRKSARSENSGAGHIYTPVCRYGRRMAHSIAGMIPVSRVMQYSDWCRRSEHAGVVHICRAMHHCSGPRMVYACAQTTEITGRTSSACEWSEMVQAI
jgi:hypothetical protein